jgi:hypothetical protein
MNREVHYEFTRMWALECGFSVEEAELVGASDWDVDHIYDVHMWRNKGYHFGLLGASWRAGQLHRRAVAERDLVLLGHALHCAQDSIAHGFWGHVWHWRGIDRWESRGRRVRDRIERRSRAMLAGYRNACEEMDARSESPD